MKSIYVIFSVVLLMVLLYFLSAHGQEIPDEQSALRKSFETEYEAWKKDCDRVLASSKTSDRLESQHFKNIIAMEPRVLPYLVEKFVEDPNFAWIGWAWLYLTRINPDPAVNPWAKDPVMIWWQGGKRQANARFKLLYSKWNNLKAQGLSVEADNVRKSIRALGIAVLPCMIEKLDVGDTDVVQIIRDITVGEANMPGDTTAEQVKSCLSWWDKNSEKWIIPFPNKKPKANAGQIRTVASGDMVQLDGSASRDADKDELTYKWTQIAGPSVTLSDATAAKPTFTSPVVEQQTVLTFQLTVNDGSPKKSVHPSCESGESDPNTVNITVKPKG